MPRILSALLLGAGLAGSAAAAPLVVSVTDAGGKPVENAVVTAFVAGTAAKAATSATAQVAQVAQQGRQFVPQVTIVQAGTAVSFPNLDAVRHHVYSFSPVKTFELKLYAGTPQAPIVFDRTGTVVVGCNIHDRMTAWVVVVDTPWFALTDATGNARLELPEGEHLVRAWRAHDEAPAPAERKARPGGVVSLRLPAAPG